MKFPYLVISYLSLAIFLLGCNFTEDLYLNEDGSGKISLKFDGSQLMQIGSEKMFSNKKEIIDTTIVFKHFLEKNKDSISKLTMKQQEKLKRLAKFKMDMVMNSVSKEMKFDLNSQFMKVSALGDLFNDFKTASEVSNGNQKKSVSQSAPVSLPSDDKEGSRVSYSFKKNIFKRTTEIIDQEILNKSADSLEQMRFFLASSTYKLNYHFPKKIKKISAEKAMFSQDGKSFTMEVDFLDYMKNPKLLDIEVELEK